MMPVLSLYSDQSSTRIDFYVVKIFGTHKKVERTLKILRDLGASDQKTARICQDDLMREALYKLEIECTSFHDEIDQEMELSAWNQATAAKNTLLARISKTPLRVDGYQCSECLVGVDADRFGFLALLFFLRNKLLRMGFRRAILLLSDESLRLVPESTHGYFHVVSDRDLLETLKTFFKTWYPYLLPLLIILRCRTIFQECVVYRKAEGTRRDRDARPTHRPRVLTVASDFSEFPSYYSRPAAAISRACIERGHETVIITNLIASPTEFITRDFVGQSYKKAILDKIWSIWREILRLRFTISSYIRESPVGTPEGLWRLACASVEESIADAAFTTSGAILLFDALFAQFLPDILVVIPDHTRFGIAAVAVARKHGIPSVTALAGQIYDHPQYGFLNADVIAVNGSTTREIFLRRGIAPERVVVTGMAHYDETFRLARSFSQSRRLSESRLVLFATEDLPLSETFEMISAVAEATLTMSATRMKIRPHPREDPSIYEGFVRRFNSDRVAVDSTTPLLELLSTAAVCVTGFSNVAVEAMLLDLPVICMNLSGRPDKLHYAQQGAALGVYRASEAAFALDKALNSEEVREALTRGRRVFLEEHFYRVDGNASARIVQLLEKLAERRISHPAL